VCSIVCCDECSFCNSLGSGTPLSLDHLIARRKKRGMKNSEKKRKEVCDREKERATDEEWRERERKGE